MSALGSVGILAVLVRKPLAQLAPSADVDPTPLTGGDVDTLTAFGRVLIPSSFCSVDPETAKRADDVIRGTVSRHGTHPEFRDAVTLLDDASAAKHQRPFGGLTLAHQRDLVRELFTPYTTRTIRSRPYYYLTADGRRVQRAWSSVAKTILTEFYDSRLGWEVVGYARPPGECSNLVDYQHPVS